MNKLDVERVVVARITLQHYESLLNSPWSGSHRHTYALRIFRKPSTVSIIEKLRVSRLDTMVFLQRLLTSSESSMKDLQHKLYTMAD